MIRRGDEFRIGPIRIPVLDNSNGMCTVVPIYGAYGSLGMTGTIDEETLEQLAEEDGVTVRRSERKPRK